MKNYFERLSNRFLIKCLPSKVAGTHPDLAPDVEMKLCFPRAKGLTTTPDSKTDDRKQEDPEVFYYRNNQLLPAPHSTGAHDMRNHLPAYDRFDHKPYYNNRRSLSLARIDSGLSGELNETLKRFFIQRNFFQG